MLTGARSTKWRESEDWTGGSKACLLNCLLICSLVGLFVRLLDCTLYRFVSGLFVSLIHPFIRWFTYWIIHDFVDYDNFYARYTWNKTYWSSKAGPLLVLLGRMQQMKCGLIAPSLSSKDWIEFYEDKATNRIITQNEILGTNYNNPQDWVKFISGRKPTKN